jgi:membrane-associated phospholipid phosphatase
MAATLARFVSEVASPPCLGLIAALLTARATGTWAAWAWAGLHALLAVLLPVLYIAWLVRRGRVTNMHLRVREERFRPLVFSIVAGACSVVALGLGGAPHLLVVLAVLHLVQLAFFLGLTLRWKVSVHCAAASGLAVLAVFLWGTGGALLGPGVPLIAWSRVYLARHTPLQTMGGALLGAGLWIPTLAIWGG